MYCLKCLKFSCAHPINVKINWSYKYPRPKATVRSLKKFLSNSQEYTVYILEENTEALELARELFGKEHVRIGNYSCLSSISKLVHAHYYK